MADWQWAFLAGMAVMGLIIFLGLCFYRAGDALIKYLRAKAKKKAGR